MYKFLPGGSFEEPFLVRLSPHQSVKQIIPSFFCPITNSVKLILMHRFLSVFAISILFLLLPGGRVAARQMNPLTEPGDWVGTRGEIGSDNQLLVPLRPRSGTVTGGSIWPLELAVFTAQASKGLAQLSWTTASENDPVCFTVEVSANGTLFHDLGRVAAQVNRSGPRSYCFTDAGLSAYALPLVYYRLRQTDRDSTNSFSPVRTVAVPAGLPVPFQVWPTLVSTGVWVTGMVSGQVVQLWDIQGRLLRSVTSPAACPLQLSLPAALTPGIYLVRSRGQIRRVRVE